MNIGNSIKVALVKKGMKQTELAVKMGCKPLWISRLANSASASGPTIEQLATAFDMKVSEFVALGED